MEGRQKGKQSSNATGVRDRDGAYQSSLAQQITWPLDKSDSQTRLSTQKSGSETKNGHTHGKDEEQGVQVEIAKAQIEPGSKSLDGYGVESNSTASNAHDTSIFSSDGPLELTKDNWSADAAEYVIVSKPSSQSDYEYAEVVEERDAGGGYDTNQTGRPTSVALSASSGEMNLFEVEQQLKKPGCLHSWEKENGSLNFNLWPAGFLLCEKCGALVGNSYSSLIVVGSRTSGRKT